MNSSGSQLAQGSKDRIGSGPYNDCAMQEVIPQSSEEFLWRKNYVIWLKSTGVAIQEQYENLANVIEYREGKG